MVRITVDELVLPSGQMFHKGDVVRTEEFPGLETALAAGVAEDGAKPSEMKSPVERMRKK